MQPLAAAQVLTSRTSAVAPLGVLLAWFAMTGALAGIYHGIGMEASGSGGWRSAIASAAAVVLAWIVGIALGSIVGASIA